MTNLGSGIDELNVDLFGLPRLDSREDGFSKSDGSLSGSNATTLKDNEILVDLTVVGEATKRSDVLDDSIGLSGGVVLNTSHGTSSNSVDLVVDVSSGVIAKLTASSDGPLDGRWMPGTNTGDLSETSMCLTVKSGHTESLDDTSHTLTAGNTDGVNALGHLEDLTDADFLLELVLGEIDLISDGTTVDLDLQDVSLVLTESELADLSGANDTDGGGVFLDTVKISGVVLLGVGVLILLLNVLAESLLLGVHPVLVESALDISVKVLSEHGGEGTETAGGLNVSDDSNDLHGRALNDRDGVDNILLDGLLSLTTLLIFDDMGHTGLIAHEGGKVNGLGGVIAGE